MGEVCKRPNRVDAAAGAIAGPWVMVLGWGFSHGPGTAKSHLIYADLRRYRTRRDEVAHHGGYKLFFFTPWASASTLRSLALCNFGVPADLLIKLPEPIRLRPGVTGSRAK